MTHRDGFPRLSARSAWCGDKHRYRVGLSRKRRAQRLSVDEGSLAIWEKGIAHPSGKRVE